MSKPRILVVYFSRSGATRGVASELAKILNADLEEIVEPSDRSGPLGYLRSLIDAVNQRAVDILPAKHDVCSYELVVIGTPVWAGSVSAPVRAWLTANKARLRRVAFFCTLGGRGGESAINQMGSLAGKQPVARCTITAREARRGDESRLLAVFTDRLNRTLARIDEMEWLD